MTRIVIIFSILGFYTHCYATELTASKTYPPYPPIWGYDLSEHQAIKDKIGRIDAYRMPDGDIWFLFGSTIQYKDPIQMNSGGYKEEQKYILLKFFKNEQIELDQKNRIEFIDNASNKKLSNLDNIVYFSDGSNLKYFSGLSPKLCFVPQFIKSYFVKTDLNNNKKKYTILGASPHVEIWEDKGLCDVQGAPFFYQKLHLLNILIDLGDDTFIAYAPGSNLIVRFDKNLNTNFKPIYPVTSSTDVLISRNFFVVDYSVLEDLEGKIGNEIPFYQTVHDELLLYLQEKYH